MNVPAIRGAAQTAANPAMKVATDNGLPPILRLHAAIVARAQRDEVSGALDAILFLDNLRSGIRRDREQMQNAIGFKIEQIESDLAALLVERSECAQKHGFYWPEKAEQEKRIYDLKNELDALKTDETTAEIARLRSEFWKESAGYDSAQHKYNEAIKAKRKAQESVKKWGAESSGARNRRTDALRALRELGAEVGTPEQLTDLALAAD